MQVEWPPRQTLQSSAIRQGQRFLYSPPPAWAMLWRTACRALKHLAAGLPGTRTAAKVRVMTTIASASPAPDAASAPVSGNLAPLKLLIAAPRGFCAGVDRAIEIVERALDRSPDPVYVRHEIVHNRFVVEGLKAKGAVFIEDLADVPDGAQVVFSAHGVPKHIPIEATTRGLDWLDATCPLVSKVHRQAERQVEAGRHILFVGHKGHPEVIGTMGQVPVGTITLVETLDDVAKLAVPARAHPWLS